jgi:uncharacterized repeat protein (TIGR01451 family)
MNKILLLSFLPVFFIVVIGFANFDSFSENFSLPNLKTESQFHKLEISQNDIQISIDEIIAEGLYLPVYLTHAGDGSSRLFVIEQNGRIRIIKNGSVLETPYLDINSKVSCCGERGLLGLAFHPNYENNGYFYVDYTRASDGATVISRYHVSQNPDQADPNSEVVLLTIAQPYANHNGGNIAFNPKDNYLYIGMGDGGSGGDPQNHAQNINTHLGSMLRIDVDQGNPYAIPPTNPYVGRDGLDEIWAIGLRNPWRFSFDRVSGDLYIGDVGQNSWEEIDFLEYGIGGETNFGWRCKEANHEYNFTGNCSSLEFVDPIAEYDHNIGRSITGGYVYQGSLFPSLRGYYFYADYVTGRLWSIHKTGDNPITWSVPELEISSSLNISSFGEDENGEIYILDYTGGTVRHLTDSNGAIPILSESNKSVSKPSADPLDTVNYQILIKNTGGLINESISMSDTIPAGLEYIPDSLQATHGVTNDSSAPALSWTGNIEDSQEMTITYQVQVTGLITGSIVNKATITSPSISDLELYASISIPTSVIETTSNDFFLPGTQSNQLNSEIPSSADCDICHSEPIYDKWRGSMMSQATRDPLFWSALNIANVDAPNSGEYCLRCHTPKGWLEGRNSPSNGSGLSTSDLADGVSCALCHRLVDSHQSLNDEATLIDATIRDALVNPIPLDFIGSGAIIVDPDDRRRGPFSFGLSLPYHSAYQTDFFHQTKNAVTSSRLCGSCHNVSNPVLSWDEERSQFWINQTNNPAPSFDNQDLFRIETTYDEWLYSDYANGGVYAPQFAGNISDGIVESCQDCHMLRTQGTAADSAFNPILRDCRTTGCLPEHTFLGANSWVPTLLQNSDWRLYALSDSQYLDSTILEAERFVRKAASITLNLKTLNTHKVATVRVTNNTGHKLPTGYPEGRQMWIYLSAYDESGEKVFESGTYNSSTGQLERDTHIKVYEAKQGITPEFAEWLNKVPGETFHFILNNTIIKDNRIPPQGFSLIDYQEMGLQSVGAFYSDGQNWDETTYTLPLETERVYARLYYQTASKEYIEFLEKHGGVDGLSLYELWQNSKSPPILMAKAQYPNITYFPVIHVKK